MARLARLALAGYPHLVVQRAAARAVFVDADEARRLLAELRSALAEAEVALHAYALLPRGVWLLATPADARGLGRAMQSIGRRYVRWLNDRRGEAGGLFAGRYRAAIVEPDATSLTALCFVESRPERAAGAAADQYPWSSARTHLGLASDANLRPLPAYWSLGNTPFERHAAYRRLLEAGVADAAAQRLELAIAGGWVLGSDAFVGQIGASAARRVSRAAAGRPRRAFDATTR